MLTQQQPDDEYLGIKLLCFLDLIAYSEGTSANPLTKHDGFDVIVTGEQGPSVFTDFADHPFAAGRPAVILDAPCMRFPNGLRSTAAGRYQIMLSTWHPYKTMLKLLDFGPESQDAVARELIRERGAYGCLDKGDIAGAITRCANIWASLPGNDYGQGGKSMQTLLAKWQEFAAEPPRPSAA